MWFGWGIKGLYTGGKGPESLFIRLSWDLMCHASSAHLWWKLGCPSITVALLQSMALPSSTTCCATADRLTSPDTSALLCSLRRCCSLGCDLFGRCTPWCRTCRGSCRPRLPGVRAQHDPLSVQASVWVSGGGGSRYGCPRPTLTSISTLPHTTHSEGPFGAETFC